MSNLNLKTMKAYKMKQAFQEIYKAQDEEQYKTLLNKWYKSAIHSSFEPIKSAAKTIKSHWNGIVIWIHNLRNNGILEGFNSVIQAAKSKARGYKTSKCFKKITYLLTGKLDFSLLNLNYRRVQPMYLLIVMCAPALFLKGTENHIKKIGGNMDFSLIYYGKYRKTNTIDKEVLRNLDFNSIFKLFEIKDENKVLLENILTNISLDKETVIYRQEIIEDLLKNPDVIISFEKIIPIIENLGYYLYSNIRKTSKVGIGRVFSKLNEINSYIECIEELYQVLSINRNHFKSIGIQSLFKFISEIYESEKYQKMKKTLPNLLSKKINLKSISIGINFDKKMNPSEITLLSISNDKYQGSKFLDNILSIEESENKGIGKLHSNEKKDLEDFTKIFNLFGNDTELIFDDESGGKIEGRILKPLFKDIDNILKNTILETEKELEMFCDLNTKSLVLLKNEMEFYISSYKMINKIKLAGFPICKPVIEDSEKKLFKVTGMYNLNLASKLINSGKQFDKQIILNNFEMNSKEGIFILTGPNSGGKTTFIESIGIIQLLAQAGLYIPTETGEISMVDNLFTHYQTEEETDKETGRFGQEARRIKSVFEKISGNSLLIMNESFSSTSEADGYYIVLDILNVLKKIGVRTIFATHLHALANDIEEINKKSEDDTNLVSIVANVIKTLENGKEKIMPTYKITKSEPLGKSFAREVANCYGIGFNQLIELVENKK